MLSIYRKLYPQRIFTLHDLEKHYKKKQVAKNTAYRLVKKKLAQRITAGLYSIIPLDEKDYTPDPILVGSRLAEPYFFSHRTALQLHKFVEPDKKEEITLSARGKKTFTFEGVTYNIALEHNFSGADTLEYKGHKIYVSDVERTFLDCLDSRMKMITFLGIAQHMQPSFKKLLKYLEKFDKKVLYAKAGYALELLKYPHITDKELEKLQEKIGRKIYYIEKANPVYNRFVPKRYKHFVAKKLHKEFKFVKRWRLMVPEEVINYATLREIGGQG